MKLPIVQVADLLEAANFSWVEPEHIYTTNVTPDEDDSGKTTFIRIQDSVGRMAYYANDIAFAQVAGVEVQIFFSNKWSKLTKDENLTIYDAKVAVLKKLQANGWKIQNPLNPDTPDPDTGQKTATIYVTKILEMEN